LSANESSVFLMPESHPVFSKLPTQEYSPAGQLSRKINEARVEPFEHHAKLGELTHVAVNLLREARRFFLQSLGGFVGVVWTRAKRRNFEFAHNVLPSPVVTHCISNDSADEWQHLVCFIDCEYALHARTVRR
jgi:hypothetical protein